MDSKEKYVLLVEDNPDDEMLVLLALKENDISNTVIVKRDGKAALDYLLGADSCTDRNGGVMPSLVLWRNMNRHGWTTIKEARKDMDIWDWKELLLIGYCCHSCLPSAS